MMGRSILNIQMPGQFPLLADQQLYWPDRVHTISSSLMEHLEQDNHYYLLVLRHTIFVKYINILD